MDNITCEFIGEFPQNRETGWSDKLQGVCHDASNWYFSQSQRLFRIPASADLNARLDPSTVSNTRIPQELADLGFVHMGDFDCRDGILYVPLEGGQNPVLALFDATDGELKLLQWMTLSGQSGGPWCAVHPTTGDIFSSNFYTSGEGSTSSKVIVYARSSSGSRLDLKVELELLDEQGQPLLVEQIQGGTFDPDGLLYLVSDVREGGIMAFDAVTGRRVMHRPVVYHPGRLRDELEGITYWDREFPGFGGQLHLIMVDVDLGDDDLYFKHFRISKGRA